MSKKRGLSLEEKRERMLQIFYEKKTFFQLKELEKIAPKEKGITSMSVKEVLQSLVDDCMVDSERIGTSNYFWSYPSKGLNLRKRKLEELSNQVESITKKINTNHSMLEKVKEGKEETTDRTKILSDLSELEEENKKLAEELEQYQDCDPDVLEGIKRQADLGLESANRWTDNIFQVKSWCKRKFNIEGGQLDKQFGIPEDLDYVEE